MKKALDLPLLSIRLLQVVVTMACVADKLLASQFAYIGSIGVLAQLPNFNKLKKNDIEFEQHTAEFKRTLTIFGENNDEGRAKFKEEIEEIHVLFKDFVHSQRPDMDADKVATEYWPGVKAKALGLIDDITTSDGYILSHCRTKYLVLSIQ